MKDELQAGIDSMRELIKDACVTDIGSASVLFFRELFDELDELQTKIARFQDRIALLMAERNAARGQLAGVPVNALRRWYENSNPQLMEYEFIADVETDAEFIEAWLETQVTP